MPTIPTEVRQYLATADALAQAELRRIYPQLTAELNSPRTRQAMIDYLQTDEAWSGDASGFVQSVLSFLRAQASLEEGSVVRVFVLHASPYVRLRAYEFLLTLYFPDKNKQAMFLLLHSMLSDMDDTVRAQAARYIERAQAQDELKNLLKRWYQLAPTRGWTNTESYELVGHLLAQ